jgi:hypothetical protein
MLSGFVLTNDDRRFHQIRSFCGHLLDITPSCGVKALSYTGENFLWPSEAVL